MNRHLITPEAINEVTLSDSARSYVRRSRAPNTLRTYRAALSEFSAHYGELPASVAAVTSYIADLADAGAKVATIEVKLSAVAYGHRAARLPDPTVTEEVKAVMAGIRRQLRRAPNRKEPVTLDQLRAMIETLDLRRLKGLRDRALLLVGFAGAFRRSELVALQVADVRLQGSLRALVRQSKSDQEGEGLMKTIPKIGGPLCPVAALQAWLDAAAINSGLIFRRLDRWSNVYDDAITPQSVALVVKDCAAAAGLDWRVFSGHSLRSGFVTEAMDAGASDSDVMQQTGHESVRTLRGYRKRTGVGASRAVLAAFGVDDRGAT